MKYVCSKCGRHTLGSQDSVLKKGWVITPIVICKQCLDTSGGAIEPKNSRWDAHNVLPHKCPRCNGTIIKLVTIHGKPKYKCASCGWVW